MVKLSFCDQGLCNDGIAKMIREPRPLSISELLEHISKEYKCTEITELDLSSNNVCDGYADGLILIINFVIENLPNIEKLDLSSNYIEHNEATIKLFNRLLLETNLHKIKIKGTKMSEHYKKYITNLFTDFGDKHNRIRLGIKF